MLDEYYGEDIYEPTLADEILTEASTKLRDAIKQDVAAHIKKIETRNERLEAEIKSLRDEACAVNREKRELDRQREELARKAARISVEDFLGQRAVIMYRADYEYIQGPKCDRCNYTRHRPYKTPLGNDATEKCPCATRKRINMPKEYKLCTMERRGRGEVKVWFKQYSKESDSFSSSQFVTNQDVYSGGDFASLDRYRIYFAEEPQCQKYCDWLNN